MGLKHADRTLSCNEVSMGLCKKAVLNRHACLIIAVVGSALVLSATAAYAQSPTAPPSNPQSSDTPSSSAPSLGDLVRKQKQKQQEEKDKGAKPKKVVTDEDMPEHPQESSTDAAPGSNDGPRADAEVTPASAVAHTGEEWKAAISQQKSAIADLKSRIEKVQSSIHFVEANAYRNGVQYNKAQAHKQEEVERAQNQLVEMQKNLEKMQEDARRAGYGSAVWDP
jgi:hypothetical protein